MLEPIWVSEQLALAIHERQLAEHGGLYGVRDRGLLSSALARPRHILAFSAEPADVAQLAGAYAYGIAKNHPFIDGNKRTAAVVMEAFIRFNGMQLLASNDAMYKAFIQLADSTLSEEEFAEWIRQHIEPA